MNYPIQPSETEESMAKSKIDTKQFVTREEILDKLKELTDELNKKRELRSRENDERRRSHRNPNVPDPGGSIDVYTLSMQIEGMVKFVIALGMLPPETDVTDWLC